jgi:hypothetical protein
MPAGTYDVTVPDGTIKLGSLPEQVITSPTAFVAAIGSTPVAQPIELAIPDVDVSTPLGTAKITTTIAGAGVTVDPATGDATFDASFLLSANVPGVGTCTLGTSGSPVTVHLSTADGSPWDATTGKFQMADKTFALPAPDCGGNAILSGAIGLVLSTAAGANSIVLNGIATRRVDTSTTTQTPGATGPSGGGITTTPGGNPSEVTPLNAPSVKKFCVVPKLVGKTLKQAKRALKKAGCKVGKAKKKNSKKRKKGRILKQRYKVGTKLPAGTKIPLTVSKGKKKARSHRSR